MDQMDETSLTIAGIFLFLVAFGALVHFLRDHGEKTEAKMTEAEKDQEYWDRQW